MGALDALDDRVDLVGRRIDDVQVVAAAVGGVDTHGASRSWLSGNGKQHADAGRGGKQSPGQVGSHGVFSLGPDSKRSVAACESSVQSGLDSFPPAPGWRSHRVVNVGKVRTFAMQASRDIGRLIEIMAALRTPGTGCPWDLEQNFATIAP